MARERMVTRTVEVSNYEVMTCNVETAEVLVIDFKLGGTYDKTADAMKVLKKQYETDTLKLVAIQSCKVESILYGMPESKFIEMAQVLPPRKVNENEK